MYLRYKTDWRSQHLICIAGNINDFRSRCTLLTIIADLCFYVLTATLLRTTNKLQEDQDFKRLIQQLRRKNTTDDEVLLFEDQTFSTALPDSVRSLGQIEWVRPNVSFNQNSSLIVIFKNSINNDHWNSHRKLAKPKKGPFCLWVNVEIGHMSIKDIWAIAISLQVLLQCMYLQSLGILW